MRVHRILLLFLCLFIASTTTTHAWTIKSIDTMKLSRDGARNPQVNIAFWVEKVASLHANYIAIDTPYDNEFTPVLTQWVSEARKNHLHVWFRGNFSGWEGWFDYSPITDMQHYQKTSAFIKSHPDIFQEGDIFTPAPEPENGIIGDPRSSQNAATMYKKFLITSYTTCQNAFQSIKKKVSCGYFSMNGDIALHILDQPTVDKIGNVIVIDHYVQKASDMGAEIDALKEKFHAKIVIGEFGAPIDGITSQMNDIEQEKFVFSILQTIAKRSDVVLGFNYWVIAGGSTALAQTDGTSKAVATAIDSFYDPVTISALVKNFKSQPIPHKKIHTSQGDVYTNTSGDFAITFPKGLDLTISIDGDTKPVIYSLKHVTLSKKLTPIVLQPKAYSIWDNVQLWLITIRHFFSRL